MQQESQYLANTRLLLRTAAQDAILISDPNAQVPFFADRQLANELQVIESAPVQDAVEKAYDGDLSVGSVSASVVEAGSDAVELSVKASDADAAAELANLYAEKYLEFSQNNRFEAFESANETIGARIAELNDRRAAAVLRSAPKSELDAFDNQLAGYLRTQENLALSMNLQPSNVAQVLTVAVPPSDPVSPKPVRDGIIGFMAGAGLGLALALAREFLDQSIRTTDDLERALKGRYPILGVIPDVSAAEIAMLPGPGSHTPVAEAYRRAAHLGALRRARPADEGAADHVGLRGGGQDHHRREPRPGPHAGGAPRVRGVL